MASSKKNYDVFLSFRGPDVRNNFLSHLYAALDQNGIHTFLDNEKLRKGEQISPTLVSAIEESCIAIIIFSKDYASSRWCLEELVKIMECKAQKGLIVLPVFYKVEPREVRRAYKRTMANHKTKFGKDSKIVEGWKKALFEAGNLSGWHINDEDEAKIIQGIVKDVSSRLEQTTPLHVAEYSIGIDSRVKEVKSLLQKDSDDDDVLMIGLWGPGGIGKTTLAKAIYNAIQGQFEGSSFLDRVRETSNKSDGLVDLQQKLLSQILSPGHPMVYTKDGGISLIKKRLCCKKVLLVLDDVDQSNQLEAIAGGGDWFGKGSRIFVTTRDRHLLTSHCKSCVYEVKTLKNDEALELFLRHAFPNGKKVEMRKDLIYRALHYASGLPLALKVLGSFLRGSNESEWESALDELSKSPDETINGVLKISFNGLGKNEREIFLDIACFFKGLSIEYIKKVLDACGFGTTMKIKILIDRSLIINEHGTLQMHDLVQSRGKNIVMQDDLDKRSRLWLFEDFLDILDEDTGKSAVEAIALDLRTSKEMKMSLGEITIKADAFRSMKKLRMLILPEVHIPSEGPVRFPSNLRWLEWPKAPYLEFGSGQKKLVGLDVHGSPIKHLGGKFKDFVKLKYIDFNHCESLVSVPDLSSAPNLESLNLEGCNGLVELHQSVAYLNNLKLLSLHSCSNLNVLPNTLNTKSLQTLDLFGCSKLENFPDIPRKMEHLEELNLGRTAIKELPASIENLLFVKKMHLRNCKNLAKLPSSIYKLQNLEHLSLRGCSNLVMFPKEDLTDPNGNPGFSNLHHLELGGCNLSEVEFLNSYSSFPKLGSLNLSGNKFTHLPTCITKYDALEHLSVVKCKQLQKIPQLPPNLHSLQARSCRSLQELPDLSGLSSNGLRVDFSLCRELFHKRANIADVLSLKVFPKMRVVDILLSGRRMPEWFHHCKDASISFMVPGDLSNKFLGLALCIVLRAREGKAVDVEWVHTRVDINNHQGWYSSSTQSSLKSDLVWIEYLPRSELHIERELPQDDWSHFQVSLEVPGGRLIKWGFRLINEQQEDDLKIVFQDHQPNETNRSSEERDAEEDNWTSDVEEESPWETLDDFREEKDFADERKRGATAAVPELLHLSLRPITTHSSTSAFSSSSSTPERVSADLSSPAPSNRLVFSRISLTSSILSLSLSSARSFMASLESLTEDLLVRIYEGLDSDVNCKSWRLMCHDFRRIDALTRSSLRVLGVEFLQSLLANSPRLHKLDLSVCRWIDDGAVLLWLLSWGAPILFPRPRFAELTGI
ncbi:hypothetical protein BT93_J1464 [Corymbia citriodora subsp. variegata]|nr:hypothetical protein BT93_J1464 [Corymbia citriodora subsp. variegata]